MDIRAVLGCLKMHLKFYCIHVCNLPHAHAGMASWALLKAVLGCLKMHLTFLLYSCSPLCHLHRYGIMGIGAVCHTLNPRLSDSDITYIANHGQVRQQQCPAASTGTDGWDVTLVL
jgi:acyl-CoA synthetase (AMP-forming)/AMP-acid ligase II